MTAAILAIVALAATVVGLAEGACAAFDAAWAWDWNGSVALTVGESVCGPGSGDEPPCLSLMLTEAWVEVARPLGDFSGLSLGAGRRALSWGPGRSGQLLLSANAPVDLVWYEWQSGPYRYVHAAGLRGTVGSGTGLPSRPGYPSETGAGAGAGPLYFLGHRLEWRVSDDLTLGIAETVASSGDDFRLDLLYLAPVVPFYLTQYLVARQDRRQDGLTNVNLGLDARWTPATGVELYGELMVDDAPGTGWAAERVPPFYGLLLGAEVEASALPWLARSGVPPGGAVWIEYVRMANYTYSHRNPDNDYLSYGRLLGHWLGPDADAVVGGYEWQAPARSGPRGCVGLEFSRHGEGDVGQPWRSEFGAAQPFPSGVVETRVGLWGRAGIRMWPGRLQVDGEPYLELVIGASVAEVQNAGHTRGRREADVGLNAALVARF